MENIVQLNLEAIAHIDDNICELISSRSAPVYWNADLLDRTSAWFGHIPFAHWLIATIKPSIFVELGSHEGVSYASFCRAAKMADTGTRCYAVDTWEGDAHAGIYGSDVYHRVVRHNEQYENFSTLLRSTFDDALEKFEDGTVDLLHIDGFHTYEAVEHDFRTWLPKLSNKGIVLFHDINEFRDGFGVWRFWSELKKLYPNFEFLHGHGLGVLLCGKSPPAELQSLCSLDEVSAIDFRERFQFAGDRWLVGAQLAKQKSQHAALENRHAAAFSELRKEKDHSINALNQQMNELNRHLAAIQSSSSWRFTRPLRAVSDALRKLKHRS